MKGDCLKGMRCFSGVTVIRSLNNTYVPSMFQAVFQLLLHGLCIQKEKKTKNKQDKICLSVENCNEDK